MNGALKSKTMWFALAVTVAGFVEQNMGVIENLIPVEYRGMAISAVGLAIAVLRFKTTTALTDK